MQKLSSIEFRRKIHSIKTMKDLTTYRKYIVQFVFNKFQNKECVDKFLKGLDSIINNNYTLDNIKIWIFNYKNNSGVALLGDDPETPLYNFIRSRYTEINTSFHNFYQEYVNAINSNPLNKNHISRALNALGINPMVKKIKNKDNKRTCITMIHVPKEGLSEIFKRNGFTS